MLKENAKARVSRIDPAYIRRSSRFKVGLVFLSLLCCSAAGVWWLRAGVGNHPGIYSPGQVAKAHSLWGNQCERCHKPENGKFSLVVQDSACLACHDGPIHNSNQLTSEIALANDHPYVRGCANCHKEHHGEAMLIGAADQLCINCHANMKDHSKEPLPARFWNSVVAFDNSHHPPFGRNLTPPDKAVSPANWVDPTQLWFNHKKHLTLEPSNGSSAKLTCMDCHKPQPSGGRTGAEGPGEAPSDGRYMQPIRYAEACAKCHPISLPQVSTPVKPNVPEILLPHADLNGVRAALAAQLHPTLSSGSFHGPGSEPPKRKSRLPGAAAPAATPAMVDIPKQQWLRQNAHAALDLLQNCRSASFAPYTGTIPDSDTAAPMTGDIPEITDSGYIDVQLALVALGKCNLCHKVDGAFPSLNEPEGAISLSITPTGITHTPRRWFNNSVFDHRAHRDMSCVECHARALTSEKTSDVLSPNLVWQNQNGVQASCADCHHPATGSSEAASSNCITCHRFHMRTEENAWKRPADVAAVSLTTTK